MTKSADPDSWLLKKPTDLDLHCLLRQGMSCSARERLKEVIIFFPFKVDCFLEGVGVQESKREVILVIFLVKYGGKSTWCIHSPCFAE